MMTSHIFIGSVRSVSSTRSRTGARWWLITAVPHDAIDPWTWKQFDCFNPLIASLCDQAKRQDRPVRITWHAEHPWRRIDFVALLAEDSRRPDAPRRPRWVRKDMLDVDAGE